MQKILVIKHGALGDIMQAIDAFESLRRSFASAHITVLTAPPFASLLRTSGWFDEVISDARKPPWNLAYTLNIAQVIRQPFDAIIDLQCSSRTARYFRLFRPKARWFGTVKGCSDPMPDFAGVNNRDRMICAVQMAGAREYKGSLSWLGSQPSQLIADIPESYCVLIAGSSQAKPSKRWPAPAFAEIAQRSFALGITPIICGTAEDKIATLEIASRCANVMDLTGQTSLAELAQLMAGAEFILGNDTGPVFVGARTDVPCLMVMGPDTDPSMSAPTGAQASFIKAEELTQLSAQTVWARLQEICPSLSLKR